MISLLEWVTAKVPVKSFNVRTPEAKTRHWKQVDRRRQGWHRAIVKQAARLFRTEGARVANTFRDARGPVAGQELALLAVNAGRAQWQAFYTAAYLTVGKDFANSVWRSLGARKGRAVVLELKDVLEDEWTRLVLDYVNTVGADRVVGIGETTKTQVRAVIANGIAEGHTMPEIADAIQAAYGSFADYRAERIARTEVVGASNSGSQMAALATGMTLNKEWISTRDERTRGQDPKDEFDHVHVDGQLRRIEEPYEISGESMRFPGDGAFGASAGNVINCRCVEAYARPEDLIAPSEDPQDVNPVPSEEPGVPVAQPNLSPLLVDVSTQEEMGGGVNLTMLVNLENGKQGVWKPQSGEDTGQLRKYIPVGQGYKREVAAYEVAKLVGMEGFVPETRLRTIGGEVGSIQEFQRGAVVAKALRVRDRLGPKKDVQRIALFDYVIGNSDRHAGNWMLAERTNGTQVVLIDHGLAFPQSENQYFRSGFINHLLENAPGERLDAKLVARYLKAKDDIVATVARMVGQQEADVVRSRIEQLRNAVSFEDVVPNNRRMQ